jgi:hypothetical protein
VSPLEPAECAAMAKRAADLVDVTNEGLPVGAPRRAGRYGPGPATRSISPARASTRGRLQGEAVAGTLGRPALDEVGELLGRPVNSRPPGRPVSSSAGWRKVIPVCWVRRTTSSVRLVRCAVAIASAPSVLTAGLRIRWARQAA